MKRYKQKILGRVLRVWIAKNSKRNNEIISLNFFILDENVCFPHIQICLYSFMLLRDFPDIVAIVKPITI